MSSSFCATIANEPIGPYRVYRIEDCEQKLLLFEVSYLDKRFGVEVTNAAGEPIRLVLTEKPNDNHPTAELPIVTI